MKIRITLTGRSYHLAADLPRELELTSAATVAEALAEINARLPDDTTLPDSCIVSVSGRHIGSVTQHENVTLQDDDEVLLIAPVAGG